MQNEPSGGTTTGSSLDDRWPVRLCQLAEKLPNRPAHCLKFGHNSPRSGG